MARAGADVRPTRVQKRAHEGAQIPASRNRGEVIDVRQESLAGESLDDTKRKRGRPDSAARESHADQIVCIGGARTEDGRAARPNLRCFLCPDVRVGDAEQTSGNDRWPHVVGWPLFQDAAFAALLEIVAFGQTAQQLLERDQLVSQLLQFQPEVMANVLVAEPPFDLDLVPLGRKRADNTVEQVHAQCGEVRAFALILVQQPAGHVEQVIYAFQGGSHVTGAVMQRLRCDPSAQLGVQVPGGILILISRLPLPRKDIVRQRK